MKPTVGRIVHYFPALDSANPRAAIITAVHDEPGDVVDLKVFPPRDERVHHACVVSRTDTPQEMHWMWPPRS